MKEKVCSECGAILNKHDPLYSDGTDSICSECFPNWVKKFTATHPEMVAGLFGFKVE